MNIISFVTLTLGDNVRLNMINACIRQMKEIDESLWYFYIEKSGLKDMIKYQRPDAWDRYYMDGESMVVLVDHNMTDKETHSFDFQRDIIDSQFNTSKLQKLWRGGEPVIWYSW